ALEERTGGAHLVIELGKEPFCERHEPVVGNRARTARSAEPAGAPWRLLYLSTASRLALTQSRPCHRPPLNRPSPPPPPIATSSARWSRMTSLRIASDGGSPRVFRPSRTACRTSATSRRSA